MCKKYLALVIQMTFEKNCGVLIPGKRKIKTKQYVKGENSRMSARREHKYRNVKSIHVKHIFIS